MQTNFTRYLFLIVLGLAVTFSAVAQDAFRVYVEPSGWSIGTTFGETDMWGNVGTKSPIDHYSNSHYTDKTVFMGGLMGRYTIHPCLSFRFSEVFGTLYATDLWNYDAAKKATNESADAYQRYVRHQDAKTYIFETMGLLEYEPFRMNPESHSAHRRGQLYIVAGFGYMHFTPYTTVGTSSTWVNSYDLHLEGQGFGKGFPSNYSLWTPIMSQGLGYRWDIGQHLNLGVEFIYRETFTHYLDGVSGKYIDPKYFAENLSPTQAAQATVTADKGVQYGLTLANTPGSKRGNASLNDAYSSLAITFYYKIQTATNRWWKVH